MSPKNRFIDYFNEDFDDWVAVSEVELRQCITEYMKQVKILHFTDEHFTFSVLLLANKYEVVVNCFDSYATLNLLWYAEFEFSLNPITLITKKTSSYQAYDRAMKGLL